jgi:hypothetical protein
MSLSTLHDTSHDMYLPNKRARSTPPRIAKENVRSDPPAGDQSAREAWMRAKQARKQMRKTPRMSKFERGEVMLANRRPAPPKLGPSQRADDINEAEHSKKEGQYEACLVAQAFRAANKGVK